MEARPPKPGAGALAALAAALQSSHDVDADGLQPNASSNAAALRARQQKPAEAKPRWGIVHTGGSAGSSGSSAAELDAWPVATHGGKRHIVADGIGAVDDADG